MKYFNDYDIARAEQCCGNRPVLARAIQFLKAFKDEVDSHSDGWAYWNQPVQAAAKLMGVIEIVLNWESPDVADITEAQLNAALSPIRSFYTRRGYAAGMTYPTIS